VILVTLVGQGLSLPWLVRALGVSGDGGAGDQERRARRVATAAAVARLDALAAEQPAHRALVAALRAQYAHRADRLEERPAEAAAAAATQELLEERQLRRAVVEAERAAVLELRTRGALDDQAWRRIQRELDLEALRLDA